jgi:Holliday junction resolvase RusA-like endonuclease
VKARIPKPPSVNHLYAYTCRGGFARSYITKKGEDWFTEAGLLLKVQMKVREPINYQLGAVVHLYTVRMNQDVDNILKAVFDVLQKTHIIENDSLITRVTVEKHKVAHIDEEGVELELLRYEG